MQALKKTTIPKPKHKYNFKEKFESLTGSQIMSYRDFAPIRSPKSAIPFSARPSARRLTSADEIVEGDFES